MRIIVIICKYKMYYINTLYTYAVSRNCSLQIYLLLCYYIYKVS